MIGESTLDVLEPEGYLQPKRYRIHAECERCGHRYSWVTTKLDGKDKPCPKAACREAATEEEIERRALNMARMLEEQRAPAQIGANVVVKAVDTTAEIVMADHKLTDLRDNIRPGDSMAPKLPPEMQRRADGFFGGAAVAADTRFSRKMKALGARALAGAYKDVAANPGALYGKREPGEPALRSIGKDPISR